MADFIGNPFRDIQNELRWRRITHLVSTAALFSWIGFAVFVISR